MKKLIFASLCMLMAFMFSPQLQATPYFSLETGEDFQSAIDSGDIKPQTVATDDLEDHYPENTFAVSELYVYEDEPSDPDGGLVMGWGDDQDVEYYAQWLYVYDEDPSLVALTLNATVFAPVGINSISLGIYQQANPLPGGPVRAWDWNVGPGTNIPHNIATTVSITIAAAGLGSVNEATPVANSFFDNGVNPANINAIGADENGNWVRFAQVNPATGQPQPWNYWVSVSVTPEPATIALLALGGAVIVRKRKR